MIYKKINLKHHYVALSISIFILFFILEFTSIDFFIQNKFFDFSSNIFIAANYPFIENYLHKGLKNVMYAAGFCAILWLYIQIKKSDDESLKNAYIAAILATILGPLIVSILKDFTNVQCPWSLTIYGGKFPYQSFIQAISGPTTNARCFPAGHASGGFVWLSWAIIFWHTRPSLALAAAAFGSTMGLLMGISRMMQGAHFLSHTFATLLVIWLVTLLCIQAVRFFRIKQDWR